MIPLNLNPPANLPYRPALMPVFAPKAIRELEEKVRVWAVRIIDEGTVMALLNLPFEWDL